MSHKKWEEKQVEVEQAVSNIQPGHSLFLAPFCNEPQTLVQELVHQRKRLSGLTIYNMVIGSPCLYAQEESAPYFKIKTFLSSTKMKKAYLQSACDYIPMNFSEMPRWIQETNIDVVFIQVSPPNEEGYCNLGISVDITPHLIKKAKLVIAEINNNLPYTYGKTLIHESEIDQWVLSTTPVLTVTGGLPSATELTIGHHVASLIPDRSTMQIGVGRLADAILQSLKQKKDLGIHSGSITDEIIELMESGVITNEYKELNPSITVCTTLTGSTKLYEYAHHNRKIELYPARYTHNPSNLAKITNFHAINSALEVDLFGQINAEQIGNFIVAGVGGQMDFIKGARLSKGGKAIIALPSTAKGGSQSRIKYKTSSVTSLKSEVDYVVTEYGIASLFGKTLKERAEALISISHPKFREQLTMEFESTKHGEGAL